MPATVIPVMMMVMNVAIVPAVAPLVAGTSESPVRSCPAITDDIADIDLVANINVPAPRPSSNSWPFTNAGTFANSRSASDAGAIAAWSLSRTGTINDAWKGSYSRSVSQARAVTRARTSTDTWSVANAGPVADAGPIARSGATSPSRPIATPRTVGEGGPREIAGPSFWERSASRCGETGASRSIRIAERRTIDVAQVDVGTSGSSRTSHITRVDIGPALSSRAIDIGTAAIRNG
jgi:hypothetical protein